MSILKRRKRNPKTLPFGVQGFFTETEDGKQLEVWHMPVADESVRLPYIGMVFHGNAGSLENFFLMQLWFEELGIPSYSFDYRGFGKSSGWPSEKGLEKDSDAFWKFVTERENADASKIILCAFSLGSPFAARIAAKHHPKLLVLTAPFLSVAEVMQESYLLRCLRPFAWNKLPTNEYVAKLETTDLILAHGTNDNIISEHHSAELAKLYRGSGRVELIRPPYGHNDLFYRGWEPLTNAVKRFL